METVETDLELATRVAKQAGQLLLELRSSFGPVDPDDPAARRRLKDEGDRQSNELIVTAIAHARPGDAILSEEGFDDEIRDNADRVWIVDPLDGTKEFGLGRSDFAVHIALWERNATTAEKLTVGVVDIPELGITRTTGDLNPTVPPLSPDRPLNLVVSRSRPPEVASSGLEKLTLGLADAGITGHGVKLLTVGSVGAKVNEILSGRCDAYVHDTGFYEWDVAAPLAVAQHYGLTAEHLGFEPVTFNHRPPWVSNLVVCHPEVAPLLSAE